jgi:hypothetical protein
MLGLLAMPFGFDGFFWWLMGIGIDWMIVVTRWVADLPGAIGRMAAFGIGPLIAASLGIVLMGLLRTPLRWSGAAVLALAVVWALMVPQPDILISGDGHNVAVRGKDGRLHLMRTAKDAFLVKEWLAADADPRLVGDSSLAEGVSCDDLGCVVQMQGGGLVTHALRPDALADDCERAALIVTARQPPPGAAAGRAGAASGQPGFCGRSGAAQRHRPALVACARHGSRCQLHFAPGHPARAGRHALGIRFAIRGLNGSEVAKKEPWHRPGPLDDPKRLLTGGGRIAAIGPDRLCGLG